MRSPEEARIRKLEERNEDLRGAIEEAMEELEDRTNPQEVRVSRVKRILRPFDLRSKSGAKNDTKGSVDES